MLNSQDYWVPVDISIDKTSLAKSLKDFSLIQVLRKKLIN